MSDPPLRAVARSSSSSNASASADASAAPRRSLNRSTSSSYIAGLARVTYCGSFKSARSVCVYSVANSGGPCASTSAQCAKSFPARRKRGATTPSLAFRFGSSAVATTRRKMPTTCLLTPAFFPELAPISNETHSISDPHKPAHVCFTSPRSPASIATVVRSNNRAISEDAKCVSSCFSAALRFVTLSDRSSR